MDISEKTVHIFDVDGVLLCSNHRFKTVTNESGNVEIDLKYWKENQHKALEDKPLPPSEIYKKLIEQQDTFVIIATSRVMKAVDYQVIEQKLGEPHAYISRVTDEQHTGTLKLNGVLRLINDLQLKVSDINIYEDNPENLKVLANGIKSHLQIEPIAHYIQSNQGI